MTNNNTLDSPKTTIKREGIIRNKYFLRKVYEDFYNIFKENSKNVPKGKRLEIGSGGGFIKDIIPNVITSDIMKLPNCDMCFSAENIPFENNSLSAIYLLNTFHHIKDTESALKEFSRCLKKGGKVVLVEPYNSLWGRFIYQNFHHEKFDPESGWKIEGKGSLSDANGALPWIVFVRDRKKFNKIFRNLKIVKVNPHTPFRYLISGGFTKGQLLPNYFYPFIFLIEKVLRPLDKNLGMFATIVLQKIY